MNRTPIEWADYTSNPLKYRTADGRVVWACEKVSAGCTHCYAEALSHRYGGVRRAGEWNAATMAGLTPFLDEAELRRMLTLKAASGKRVFVGDMTDVFGEWVPDELLDRLFAVFALRPDVTWQVLTKRADRMRTYFTAGQFRDVRVAGAAKQLHTLPRPFVLPSEKVFEGRRVARGEAWLLTQWPLSNVWLGVSAENQAMADERIPLLLQTPAAVRFVSAEPLLGAVDLVRYIDVEAGCPFGCAACDHVVNWVIVGGESGDGARVCSVDWISSVVGQCQASQVPVFVKQLGSAPLDWGKAEATGRFRTHPETGKRQMEVTQARLHDKKGGDPLEWPLALRVREFPNEVSA